MTPLYTAGDTTGGWGEGNSLEAGKVQNLVPPGRIFVHGHKRLVYKGNHSKGSKFQFQPRKISYKESQFSKIWS